MAVASAYWCGGMQKLSCLALGRRGHTLGEVHFTLQKSPWLRQGLHLRSVPGLASRLLCPLPHSLGDIPGTISSMNHLPRNPGLRASFGGNKASTCVLDVN